MSGRAARTAAGNEPVDAERTGFDHDGISIERELEDVIGLHATRAYRARQKVAIGMPGVTNADVSILVENALLRQNPIGDGKLVPGAHGEEFILFELPCSCRLSYCCSALMFARRMVCDHLAFSEPSQR